MNYEAKFGSCFSRTALIFGKEAMEKLASLLLPEGRIVLSLDKTRKEDIEYPGRTVPVFPDTPVSIKKACANTPLRIVQRIEKEKASIGMLQRVFKIGFNRAARIMDQLAEAGVVGDEEGTKPRKILMTMVQFEEMLGGE